jgi:hypothetical protein
MDWKGTRQALTYRSSYVAVAGGSCVCLENSCRILEGSEMRIVVQMTDCRLEIWGERLWVESRSPEFLIIRGRIQRIEWAKGGGSV